MFVIIYCRTIYYNKIVIYELMFLLLTMLVELWLLDGGSPRVRNVLKAY